MKVGKSIITEILSSEKSCAVKIDPPLEWAVIFYDDLPQHRGREKKKCAKNPEVD